MTEKNTARVIIVTRITDWIEIADDLHFVLSNAPVPVDENGGISKGNFEKPFKRVQTVERVKMRELTTR